MKSSLELFLTESPQCLLVDSSLKEQRFSQGITWRELLGLDAMLPNTGRSVPLAIPLTSSKPGLHSGCDLPKIPSPLDLVSSLLFYPTSYSRGPPKNISPPVLTEQRFCVMISCLWYFLQINQLYQLLRGSQKSSSSSLHCVSGPVFGTLTK